jgi:hypothetical protein
LHVDNIEPELVKADKPVEAAVTWGTKVFRVRLEPAVAHLDQELGHQLLQEYRWLLQDATQQIRGYRCVRGINDPCDGITAMTDSATRSPTRDGNSGRTERPG